MRKSACIGSLDHFPLLWNYPVRISTAVPGHGLLLSQAHRRARKEERTMISLMEFVSICGVATMTAAGASQGLQLIRRSRGHRTDRPGSRAHEAASGRPPAGAWHEPRYGKRRAVSCGVEYVIDQRSGE